MRKGLGVDMSPPYSFLFYSAEGIFCNFYRVSKAITFDTGRNRIAFLALPMGELSKISDF